MPFNVDLEMTFPIKDGVQSYKPNFELPIEGQAVQPLVNPQAAAGTTAQQRALPQMLQHELELLGSSDMPSRTGMQCGTTLCDRCVDVSYDRMAALWWQA